MGAFAQILDNVKPKQGAFTNILNQARAQEQAQKQAEVRQHLMNIGAIKPETQESKPVDYLQLNQNRNMQASVNAGLIDIHSLPESQRPKSEAVIASAGETKPYVGFVDELVRSLKVGGAGVAQPLLETMEHPKIQSMARSLEKYRWDPALQPSGEGGAKGMTARAIGGTLPFMAATTVGAAGGIAVPLAVAYKVEGDYQYRDAIERGETEERAAMERDIVGLLNAGIEYLQVGKILKFSKGAGKQTTKTILDAAKKKAFDKAFKSGKTFTADILKTSVEEGLEEAIQETTGITVPDILNGKIPNISVEEAKRIGTAGIGGSIAGGALGGAGAVVSGLKSKSDLTKQNIQDLRAKGYMPKDVNKMTIGQISQVLSGPTKQEAKQQEADNIIASEVFGQTAPTKPIDNAEVIRQNLENQQAENLKAVAAMKETLDRQTTPEPVPQMQPAPAVEQVQPTAAPQTGVERPEADLDLSVNDISNAGSDFEIYRRVLSNATEEEVAQMAAEDGIEIPDEIIRKYKGQAWADNLIEDKNIDRIVSERAKGKTVPAADYESEILPAVMQPQEKPVTADSIRFILRSGRSSNRFDVSERTAIAKFLGQEPAATKEHLAAQIVEAGKKIGRPLAKTPIVEFESESTPAGRSAGTVEPQPNGKDAVAEAIKPEVFLSPSSEAAVTEQAAALTKPQGKEKEGEYPEKPLFMTDAEWEQSLARQKREYEEFTQKEANAPMSETQTETGFSKFSVEELKAELDKFGIKKRSDINAMVGKGKADTNRLHYIFDALQKKLKPATIPPMSKDEAARKIAPQTTATREEESVVDEITSVFDSIVSPDVEEYFTAQNLTPEAIAYFNKNRDEILDVNERSNADNENDDDAEKALNTLFDHYYEMRKLSNAKGSVRDFTIGPDSDSGKKLLNHTWVRGVGKQNAGSPDKFYTTDKDIADNFTDSYKPDFEELKDKPKNPLMVYSKEDLAKLIGYQGEPRAEKINIAESQRFDTLAKQYAQSKGHDAIIYENGTFDAPELHVFGQSSFNPPAAKEGGKETSDKQTSRIVYAKDTYKLSPIRASGGVDPRYIYDGKTLYYVKSSRDIKERVDQFGNRTPEYKVFQVVKLDPDGFGQKGKDIPVKSTNPKFMEATQIPDMNIEGGTSQAIDDRKLISEQGKTVSRETTVESGEETTAQVTEKNEPQITALPESQQRDIAPKSTINDLRNTMNEYYGKGIEEKPTRPYREMADKMKEQLRSGFLAAAKKNENYFPETLFSVDEIKGIDEKAVADLADRYLTYPRILTKYDTAEVLDDMRGYLRGARVDAYKHQLENKYEKEFEDISRTALWYRLRASDKDALDKIYEQARKETLEEKKQAEIEAKKKADEASQAKEDFAALKYKTTKDLPSVKQNPDMESLLRDMKSALGRDLTEYEQSRVTAGLMPDTVDRIKQLLANGDIKEDFLWMLAGSPNNLFGKKAKDAALEYIGKKYGAIRLESETPKAINKYKNKEQFLKIIGKSAAVQSTRYSIDGYNVSKKGEIATTDGRRLLVVKDGTKALGRKHEISDKEKDSFNLKTGELQEGNFPRWQDIIPADTKKVFEFGKVQSEKIVDVLTKSLYVENSPVVFKDNSYYGFNPDYLAEGIESLIGLGADKIEVHLQKKTDSAQMLIGFEKGKEVGKYVIMPANIGKDGVSKDNLDITDLLAGQISSAKQKQTAATAKPQDKTSSLPESPKEESRGEVKTKAIEDFGEKIGGARKDTADRGYSKGTKKIASESEEAWRKQFVVMEKVDGSGWTIGKKGDKHGLSTMRGQVFATEQEAQKAIPIYTVAANHTVYSDSDNPDKFAIYKSIGKRKRLKVVNRLFDSREDGMKYMAMHAEEILNIKTSFGEEILPVPEIAVRRGIERRTKDATPEMFMETFAPRGIEFGNWNNQDERQLVLNHAYDGLLDLAEVMNVPPKALMLDGELAIAFGARGQGLSGAKAHYEPDYGVINLTKMKGAGSLAHEWFHALDHYLARQDTKASSQKEANERGDQVYKVGGNNAYVFQSHGKSYKSGVRPELQAAYDNIIQTMYKKGKAYVEDMSYAEKFLGKAREYLKSKLDDVRVDLQADKAVTYTWRKNKKGLSPASAEQLIEFDNLANTLLEGANLDTKYIPGEKLGAGRRSNETLDALSKIYKDVRNRSGFDSQHQSGVLDAVSAAMRTYSERLRLFKDAERGTEKTKTVPTSFVVEAKKMDQTRTKDYWSQPHEMAARAFSAYVEDKIAEQGNQSDFIVYHAHGGILLPMIDGFVARPYPEGQERIDINKAFDAFVKTIKVTKTPKGFRPGFDRINSAIAEEIVSGVQHGLASANLAHRNIPQMARYYTGRAAKVLGDYYGSAGQQLSSDIKEIAFQSARRISSQWDDVEKALKGLTHSEQIALMQIGQGRRFGKDSPYYTNREKLREKLRPLNARLLEIFDRDMNDAGEAGFRRMIGGEWRDLRGSGRWYPQVLNDHGRDMMQRTINSGLSDPKVHAEIEQMIKEEDLTETPEEVFKNLIDWNNRNVRKTSGYLERERTLLPKAWVEFDPQKTLLPLIEKNALLIEGAKLWGVSKDGDTVDFTRTKELINEIANKYGTSDAEAIKKWIRIEFGFANDLPNFVSDTINAVNHYQAIARLGFRVPSALRNLTQGYVNLFTAPLSAHIKALDIVWLRPWRKSAIDLKNQIKRSGAVVGQKELAQIERGANGEPRSPKASMKLFGLAEEKNHYTAAIIARLSAEQHIKDLVAMKEGGQLVRILNAIKYVSLNPEGYLTDQIKNKTFTDTLTDAEFDKMLKGPLSLDDMDRIMHRASVDTQFIQNLTTRPIPWRTNPWLRGALKFKTFGINQTRLIYEEAVKSATKGTLAPLLKYMVFSVLAGELWNIINDLIRGRDESLTSSLINRPEKRTVKDIAYNIANDFIDGAGIGILADVSYGLTNFIVGPIGQSCNNYRKFLASLDHPVMAYKKLISSELAVSRDIEGITNRIDRAFINKNNKFIEYNRWRDRVYEFKDNQKSGSKVLTKARDILIGKPEYRDILPYEYAAKQITVGDISDAADYLAMRIKELKADGKSPSEIKRAIEASMRANSPFGNVAQKDLPKFLSQFSAEDRRDGLKFQRQWTSDYQRAFMMAYRKKD